MNKKSLGQRILVPLFVGGAVLGMLGSWIVYESALGQLRDEFVHRGQVLAGAIVGLVNATEGGSQNSFVDLRLAVEEFVTLESNVLAIMVATKDPFLSRAQQATADVAPRVQVILGVGPFTYEVRVTDEPLPDSMVAATSIDRCLVTFGREIEPHGDEALYYFAAHEMAHVYMRGHWETLPDWLEEGFADVVALEVIPSAREDAESHMRFHEGRYEAYMFARRLGVESVHALAHRAHVDGLDEIPMSWIGPPPYRSR